MTSPRSFREAFTEDPADVKDRARIVGERDSARRWAVELEGQLARVEALCDKAENPERGWRDVMFDGTPFPAFVSVDDIRSALTGGGDE